MNVGIVEYENSILSLVVNYRYVDTCDIDKTKEDIKAEIIPLKIVSGGDSNLLFYEKDSDLVRILLNSYQEETGDYESKPMTIGGGTYARNTVNSVAFGMGFPYEEELAHQINEVLSVESLEKGLAIYLEALNLLGEL
jgi:succinyl-diaminopimelate desuccinylase